MRFTLTLGSVTSTAGIGITHAGWLQSKWILAGLLPRASLKRPQIVFQTPRIPTISHNNFLACHSSLGISRSAGRRFAVNDPPAPLHAFSVTVLAMTAAARPTMGVGGPVPETGAFPLFLRRWRRGAKPVSVKNHALHQGSFRRYRPRCPAGAVQESRARRSTKPVPAAPAARRPHRLTLCLGRKKPEPTHHQSVYTTAGNTTPASVCHVSSSPASPRGFFVLRWQEPIPLHRHIPMSGNLNRPQGTNGRPAYPRLLRVLHG